MNAERYAAYVAAFNARDYDGVLAFIHPDVDLVTLGYLIKGHAGIREFYRFFHTYVTEEIQVRSVVCDARRLYAEGLMRLTGIRPLDPALLAAQGLERFTPVPAGVTVDVELWLHYEIQDGLFRTIKAAHYLPVQRGPWRDRGA